MPNVNAAICKVRFVNWSIWLKINMSMLCTHISNSTKISRMLHVIHKESIYSPKWFYTWSLWPKIGTISQILLKAFSMRLNKMLSSGLGVGSKSQVDREEWHLHVVFVLSSKEPRSLRHWGRFAWRIFFVRGYWHCGHSWPIVPASGDSEDGCGEAVGM
jgi:hypothetical protein